MFANFDIGMFFKALGLAFFLEGILWAVSPKVKARGSFMMAALKALNTELKVFSDVRGMGLLAMGAGLLVCSLLG